MARKCFFSFHYEPDCIRASQVRQIGAIEGNQPASDNSWEEVVGGGDSAIERWIANEMEGKTCLIVLVGEDTADRKWINHEIVKAWDKGLGVVGIRIHGLKNFKGEIASVGANPFDHITHGPTKQKLSALVKCYNPVGSDSKERYAWIKDNLAAKVEEAITIRKAYT